MSFGLQYPKATTKAWMYATLLHLGSVNFVFAPLKIWFFLVVLPKLIRGKLRRLGPPKRPDGAFPFRTPMHDSATDYLAARHAHLPVAKVLLGRQGHAACVPGEPPTPPPHRSTSSDRASAGPRAAGAAPPLSTLPPPSAAPRLDELLQLGGVHRDDGDTRSPGCLDRGTTRARTRVRRRACGTTLALVALSLLLCLPARLQEFIVDEVLLVLVSLAVVGALQLASLARLCAAAWAQLVRAHGAGAVLAPFAGAAAAALAVAAAQHCCAARGRADAADEARFSPVAPQRAPSRSHAVRSTRVAPA